MFTTENGWFVLTSKGATQTGNKYHEGDTYPGFETQVPTGWITSGLVKEVVL